LLSSVFLFDRGEEEERNGEIKCRGAGEWDCGSVSVARVWGGVWSRHEVGFYSGFGQLPENDCLFPGIYRWCHFYFLFFIFVFGISQFWIMNNGGAVILVRTENRCGGER
jgi:hypothetical protein